MFKSSLRPKIESILGYIIPDSEKGSVDDLRALGEKKITDLKRLAAEDEYLAIVYLKYIATKENEDYVTGFVSDVVVGNELACNWYRSVVITYNYGFNDLARMESIKDILTPLEPFLSRTGLLQIAFNMDTWLRKSPYPGALCVQTINNDYRNKLYERFAIFFADKVTVTMVKDAEVAALRWLISRLARMIWYYLTDFQRTESDLLGLIQKIAPDTKLNGAIRSAVVVLKDEMNLIGGFYTEQHSPGFIIPDEYLKTYLEKLAVP